MDTSNQKVNNLDVVSNTWMWTLRKTLLFSISAFFGVLTFCRIIFLVIKKGPKHIFGKKKRDIEPPCLNDETLGTHGYLHIEVSSAFYQKWIFI